MNTLSQRWSPSHVRRIAAATGPLALRDFAGEAMLDEKARSAATLTAPGQTPTSRSQLERERAAARQRALEQEAQGRR